MMCNKLYNHRRKMKITQKDMAKKLGVHPATYKRYENGVVEMNLSVAYEASKELGITLDQLYENLTTYSDAP